MPEAADIASKTPTYDALNPRDRAFVDDLVAGKPQYRAYRDNVWQGEGEASIDYLYKAASVKVRNGKIRTAISERYAEVAMSDPQAAVILARQAEGTLTPFLTIDDRTGLVEVDLKSEDARRNLHVLKKIKQRKRITRRTDEEGKPVTTATVEHEIEIHDAQAAAHKIRQAHGAYGPTGRADDPLHAEIRFVVEDRRSGVEERKRQHERLLTNGTAG